MRIHELLEACLEYVVVEGVLGADPHVVCAHLRTLDPHVDDAYFAHMWPLLARLPCAEVVVASDALPGTDPVPKSEAEEGNNGDDHGLNRELFRVLGDDDGEDVPVKTGDLGALLARYPQRIRLRCTEDEIYYRLTGSRKRIPKITHTIFTYLQLAARSREQGISALELGPMTDTTQNSAYHYIKVLVQLGLCAKIPASMHGSSTSVLVYRRFLEQNPHYLAYKAHEKPDGSTTRTGTPAQGQGDVEEVETEDAKTHGAAQDLGFNFMPFSELELVAGRIPKERLLRVLDHPGLKNHLLGNHHLLQVIGWPADTWQVRHRRQLQRHITSLIEEGVVEFVDIGTSARACLRLTKHNPDYTPPVKTDAEVVRQEDKEVAFDVADYDQPFQFQGGAAAGAAATQSIESQILSAIDHSGLSGSTLADIHKDLSSMFKRTLEHVINRHDLAYLPPHLQDYAIRCVIESHQRMRRLRVFTAEAYLKYMEQLGQPLEAPPRTLHTEPCADLSFRAFAPSPDAYWAETQARAAIVVPVGKQTQGRPRKSIGGASSTPRPQKAKAPRKSAASSTPAAPKTPKTSKAKSAAAPAVKPEPKPAPSPVKNKYDNDVQERGRPRKYVFVVNPDGSRNRNGIGNLLASADRPAVLIYIKDGDIAVEGLPGYTGVGKAPELTEEQIAAGKPAAFYRAMAEKREKAPEKKKGKGKVKEKGKGKGKKKADGKEDEEAAEDDSQAVEGAEAEDAEERDELADEAGPSYTPAAKRRRVGAAPAELEAAAAASVAAERTDTDAAPTAAPAEEPGPEPEPETPVRTKRPRRAAARALDSVSRSATPTDVGSPEAAEPPSKRPRRFQKVTQREPTPDPVPEAAAAVEPQPAAEPETEAVAQPESEPVPEVAIDPALVALSANADADATPTPIEVSHAMDVDASLAVDPQPEATEAVLSKDEDEQLKSIEEGEDVKPEIKPTPRVVRVDIAVLRRANEIYQCLLDSGRVLSDQKLYIEQKTWSHKYAGTDHPNAPQVGATMDRKVFKRMLSRLKDDGRIKERIATIPTTTGRWIRVPVLFIADTDEAEVQTYIRTLANTTAAAPGSPTARSKGALEYSAYRRAGPRSSLRNQSNTPQHSPAPGTPTADAMSQREAFLAEPTMAAYMYGFQSGRCLRTKILHTALIDAFTSSIESKSVVCRSPRVFALPLVFEDLRVCDYFSIVQVRGFDEEVYIWLQTPGNKELRLRDLPPEMAERASLTGRGSSGAKSMIRTLLSMLSFLQLIMPLTPVDAAEAVVHCTDDPGDHVGHFAKSGDVNTATYFLLHDAVPIYSIADTALPCLGLMSAKTPDEVNDVWSVIKQASLDQQPPFVKRIEVPPFPFTPDISGVLDMTIDHPKTLRGRNRWRHDIRLIPVQRANLDATIDMTTRTRTAVEPAAVAKLAYDNGLQPTFVEQYLDRRVRQLQGEGLQAGGRSQTAKAAVTRMKEREKRQRQKEAIREELAARIRAARKVYEERVAAAATRAGVESTKELRDYITHNRPMSRLGEIASDAELAAIIESFIRVKSGMAPVRRTTGTRPAPAVVRSAGVAAIGQAPRKRGKGQKNPNAKLRRYRHNWTKEDEEMLIDAEAVIRARCRGTTNRGRLAMTQIFPNIGDQVLRTKLKKLLEQPGREAFYHRLEDAFYYLWVDNRGSAELPDPNPGSHTDFDLKRHVDFLRERVNKNLLKLPVPSNTPSANARAPDLPLVPRDVATTYTWEYLKAVNTSMDQVIETTTAAEDTRLHNVSLASIVVDDPKLHCPEISPLTRTQGVVRAVLKMIVGTPPAIYSTHDASKVLCAPRDEYEPQIAALVNEMVLLKNISGSARQVPGRMYGFTTQWLQQSDNLLPAELETEIDTALARFANPDQTTQWPLIGSGGDIAALMTMVSNHEAEFDIDLSNLPTLRTNRLQYNTRALNDDAFEFDFAVTRTSDARAPRVPVPEPRKFPTLLQWPDTSVVATRGEVEDVVDTLIAAGIEGLERGAISQQLNMSVDSVDAVLAALAREDEPRVFWAGYNNAALVASQYWRDWSASVSPRAVQRAAPIDDHVIVPAAPRRWVDIWGDLILPDWHAALKLVLGTITTRPGLTEANLRARVAPFLDRLETADVLQYLVDTGMATRRLAIDTRRPLPPVQATDAAETPFIVWVPDPQFLFSPAEPKVEVAQ